MLFFFIIFKRLAYSVIIKVFIDNVVFMRKF